MCGLCMAVECVGMGGNGIALISMLSSPWLETVTCRFSGMCVVTFIALNGSGVVRMTGLSVDTVVEGLTR